MNEELSLVKEEEENEILSASDRVGSDEDGVNSNVLDVVVDGDDDKSDGRDDDSDDKEEDDTESVILPNNHEYRPHRDHMKTPSALASSNSKSAKVYKKLTSSDIKERVANSLKNKGSSAGKKGNGNGASRRNRVKSGTGRAASDAVKYGGIGWD